MGGGAHAFDEAGEPLLDEIASDQEEDGNHSMCALGIETLAHLLLV